MTKFIRLVDLWVDETMSVFDLTLNTSLQEETHPILFQHPEMYQSGCTHQPAVPHNSGTLLTTSHVLQ